MKTKTDPYDGYIEKIETIKIVNNPVAIAYFCGIDGRELDPEKQNTWQEGPLTLEEAKKDLTNLLKRYDHDDNVFFSAVFPSLVRLWGWTSLEAESNYYDFGIYVYGTHNLKRMPLQIREQGYRFGACGIESAITEQERKLWYAARTVQEYFSMVREQLLRAKLINPNKLLRRNK